MSRVAMGVVSALLTLFLMVGACTAVTTVSIVTSTASLPFEIAAEMLSKVPVIGGVLVNFFGLGDDDKRPTLEELTENDPALKECMVRPGTVSRATPRYVEAGGGDRASPAPTTSASPSSRRTAPGSTSTPAPSTTARSPGKGDRMSSQPALIPTGTELTDDEGYATDDADKIDKEIPKGAQFGTARTFTIVALAGGTSSWGHFTRVVEDMGRNETITLKTTAQQNAVAAAFFEDNADLGEVYSLAGSIMAARIHDDTVKYTDEDDAQTADDILHMC